jgi:predicted transcriptional regulator
VPPPAGPTVRHVTLTALKASPLTTREIAAVTGHSLSSLAVMLWKLKEAKHVEVVERRRVGTQLCHVWALTSVGRRLVETEHVQTGDPADGR